MPFEILRVCMSVSLCFCDGWGVRVADGVCACACPCLKYTGDVQMNVYCYVFRGQSSILVVPLRSLKQDLSLAWGILVRLGWLVVKTHEPICFHFPRAGLTWLSHCVCLLFYLGFKDEREVLMLPWQACYQLIYHSNPLWTLLLIAEFLSQWTVIQA